MLTLYGIKNCDTVKKARRWLEQNNIDYRFHDFRADGISETQLKQWCKAADWETLLNTRGITYRRLPDRKKKNLNEEKAIALMRAHPTLIKRPVSEAGKTLRVGFSEMEYEVFK
jgi:Spx/MgsR family transcriptional regulator